MLIKLTVAFHGILCYYFEDMGPVQGSVGLYITYLCGLSGAMRGSPGTAPPKQTTSQRVSVCVCGEVGAADGL